MAINKQITVEGKGITIIVENETEYFSLTDMLKAKDGDFLNFFTTHFLKQMQLLKEFK